MPSMNQARKCPECNHGWNLHQNLEPESSMGGVWACQSARGCGCGAWNPYAKET